MVNINKINHIAITAKLWTLSDLTIYIVVYAHYINDEWKFLEKAISFQPLLSPNTGQVIFDRLSNILLEWKALNKVSFLTLENASSNNLVASWIQLFMCDQSQTPRIPAASNYFHTQCAAHLINPIVKDSLKETSGPIDRLQESVK